MATTPLFTAEMSVKRLSARWFWLPCLLLGLGAFGILVDLPVALYFEQHKLPGDLQRFIMLCEAFGYGLTALLIMLLVRILDPGRWRAWRWAALATLGAGVAANVGKMCLARVRPHAVANHFQHDLGSLSSIRETFLQWFPQPGFNSTLQSFPSGHAATAAGLAIALSWLYPQGRWAFFALAALACFQRIASQAHFVSDVFCGAALGSLVAITVLLFAEARMCRGNLNSIAGTIGDREQLPVVASKAS